MPHPTYTGPTAIRCPRACPVPAGVTLRETPRPRHAWPGMIHCPNDDVGCERSFLVEVTDRDAMAASAAEIRAAHAADDEVPV